MIKKYDDYDTSIEEKVCIIKEHGFKCIGYYHFMFEDTFIFITITKE